MIAVMECARCGKGIENGTLCPLCEEHLEYHSAPCMDCVARNEDESNWWRGYHSRDSQVDQLVMQINRLKRVKENKS